MKLIWLTDIHLNFLNYEKRLEFYQTIEKESCDKILISGDIADASILSKVLLEMIDTIKKPIYFVHGNHDFYMSSITRVKNKIKKLTKSKNLLHWLPATGSQRLTKNIYLVGQDGWADGRYGNYKKSPVVLNDSKLISELNQSRKKGKNFLLKKMQKLADKDAKNLKQDILNTINAHKPKKIIILTHVPPYKEACKYKGNPTNKDILPFYASLATGKVLFRIAQKNRDIKFLVLCGHTHSKANFQPLNNLSVSVGQAQYYSPKIQKIITL